MNQIEAIPLPENYSITWTDMSYQERQNDGKSVLLMGMALLFGYLFPVSYTHLDVYNRQCHNRPPQFAV